MDSFYFELLSDTIFTNEKSTSRVEWTEEVRLVEFYNEDRDVYFSLRYSSDLDSFTHCPEESDKINVLEIIAPLSFENEIDQINQRALKINFMYDEFGEIIMPMHTAENGSAIQELPNGDEVINVYGYRTSNFELYFDFDSGLLGIQETPGYAWTFAEMRF